MGDLNFAQMLRDYGEGAEPVPDAEYDVVCFAAQVRKTKNQKPMIVARFRILNGVYANRVVVNNFVLSDDNPGAMFHWFRNFGFLGLGHDYFNALPVGEQALQQIANDLPNRTAHIVMSTREGRQNMDVIGTYTGAVTPQPQAPAATPGMQPAMGVPQFQQPQMPGQPVMQMPGQQAPVMQPQVAPPGMAPQPGAAPVPGVQMPGYGQQPAAVVPQPQQPMVAPNPMGAVMPQAQAVPTPQQSMGMPQQPVEQAPVGQYPDPPGMEQATQAVPQPQVAPDPAAQQYPGPPGGVQQPNGQAQAQPLPIPGTPPPGLPI